MTELSPLLTPGRARKPGCVVAVDIGGSLIKAALVDHDGVPHAERRVPTQGSAGDDDVIARTTGVIEVLLQEARLRGVEASAAGVVVPGLVDEGNGAVIASANLGWRHLPLQSLLQQRCELPVTVGHDVRAAGLAERAWGAARGKSDVLFVAVGTGIASAMMLAASRPYRGGGFAGEIGHLPIAGQTAPCACGATGCLETIASAAAIGSRFNLAAGSSRGRSAIEVASLAANGDEIAARIWSEGVQALGTALAICVRLLAPEVIVIGGGLAGAGDQLLRPLRDAVDGMLAFKRPCGIRRSELGDLAGCLGAGLLAWQLGHDPG
jgi:glucokinase